MNVYRPKNFEEIRAITDSERAALIARNVLPYLPKTDYLVVIDRSPLSHSPPAPGFKASQGNRTHRDYFTEKAPPAAPGVNLYRVEVWEATESRAEEGFVFVDPTPHSDFGPFELHLSDFKAMARPDDPRSWDYDDANGQLTFGHARKTIPGPSFDRESKHPV